MKKWKSITKRIAAMGLTAVLIANSLPVTVFAVETGKPESTMVTEEEQPESGREIITDLPEPDVTVTDEEVAAADISEDTHIEEKIQDADKNGGKDESKDSENNDPEAELSVSAANIEKEEPAGDANTMSFAELQAQLSAGGEVTLTRDYVSEGTDTGLEIPSGKTVTLDLNDHYILYKGTGSASVITVNGTLTLKDSKTPKTTRYITLTDGRATGVSDSGTVSDTCIEVTGGFIAGGNHENNNGGGVYVHESCMFTMEGGTIAGCKAGNGGGVNVNNSGMFTMEDGTIVGCKALSDGGGVFINNTGNFNMNGGSIKNCTATGSGDKRGGGGVYVSTSGKFNMEGGSITDCTAYSGGGVFVLSGNFKMEGGSITDCTATSQGGGVYVYGGTFKICGAPVIRDNKKGSDANNVAFYGSKTITVTGALTDGAEIRVNASNGSTVAVPGKPSGSTTAYTITAADVEKFHSDDTSLSPGLYGGNIVLKETLPTATLDYPTMVYNGSAFSTTISFGSKTLTEDVDYTLSYKKVVDTQETPLSAAPKDAGSYKLIVAGKGSYAGKQELDFAITQKPVTVVRGITVKDKEYDGDTTAELITTGAVFTGICDGDKLTVSDNGAGTFADKDAGESKNVNIDATKFVLGGASAGNYKLADGGHQSTATATISKKSITITGVTANDKEYDGNTTATTVTSKATVTGLAGTDAVTFTVSGAFADANKGNNKTVTLSNWNLTSGGTNYEIDASNSQKTTTAGITGAQVYIDGVTAQDKVYDGNKSATVTGTATLKRVNGNTAVDGLTVSNITAEFEDKNAGDNKAVTITGGTLSDSVNYTLVPGATTGLTANIAKASRKNEVVPNETRYGLSGSVDISGYIEEGSTVSGNMTVSGNNEIFDGKPQLNGKSISYKLKDVSGNVGQRAYITAKVSGTNYKDYIITVQVEVINCDHSNRKLVEGTTIAATCIEQGYEGDYECLDCHSIIRGEKTPIDPDNHDFDGGVEVKPPTTLTMGETKYTCSRCHKEKIVADIPCKEEEGKDYEDLRKDIEGLSGNAAPVVEPVKDDKGNEIGESVKIGGEEVEKTVTDPESGKETVKSVVWIGGLKDSYRYTGSDIKPSFHVYDGTRRLNENTDYTVKWSRNKEVGTAEITVKFKGNYKDANSETVKFEIKPAILGEDIIARETGVAVKKSAQKPVPVLVWKETGKTVPAKNFDVVYDPSEVKTAGTYTATITSKNTNFDGTATALVKVAAKDKVLSNVKVKFDPTSYPYNGKPVEPKYSLTIGTTTLTENKDYKRVSLTGNTNPGTATIIFEAISGNEAGYVGSKTATFKISGKKSLKDESIIITCAESAPYAKGGAKAAVVVTDKDTGSALKEGVDYTLSYSKNKAVGTGAEVKVKGKGNYKDTVAKTFMVTKQSLKALEGNIIVSDQFTTRSKLKAPKVTITDIDGKKLSAKTDYTVGEPDLSEKGNTEDNGIVYITITGKGNYSDTESVKVSCHYMKTVSSNIGKTKAKTIKPQPYTGNAVKLSKADLTDIVYTGSKGSENYLKPGTDFVVVSSGYSNNVKKGTAKVTIRGIGAYAGTKTLTFKIEQRQVDYQGALVGGSWVE